MSSAYASTPPTWKQTTTKSAPVSAARRSVVAVMRAGRPCASTMRRTWPSVRASRPGRCPSARGGRRACSRSDRKSARELERELEAAGADDGDRRHGVSQELRAAGQSRQRGSQPTTHHARRGPGGRARARRPVDDGTLRLPTGCCQASRKRDARRAHATCPNRHGPCHVARSVAPPGRNVRGQTPELAVVSTGRRIIVRWMVSVRGVVVRELQRAGAAVDGWY